MLNIIIFGAPGSGKGTQSTLIKEKYNLLHLSTGELLREEIAADTELGRVADSYISKGQLVPDEMIVEILDKAIEEKEKRGNNNGIILDGFPRTVAQAEALEKLIKKHNKDITVLLDLAVNEDELIERLVNRGKTSGRSDDNPDTIKKRLEVYHEKTKPVNDYYKNQNKYTVIDGSGSVHNIFDRICVAINRVQREEAVAL